MEFQKIAFLLGSAFPTPKAYGITTRETMNVLIKDLFTVRVFCFKVKVFSINVLQKFQIRFINWAK